MHPVVLKGVARTYRLDAVDVPALVDIDLVILPDRFTVISGPSGSGKTTLLNLIGCIDRPDRGTIMVGGKPVQNMSDDALSDFRARRLGFVFQNFNLLPYATALENVELPLLFAGVPAKERRERASAMLAKVDLAERMEHKPTELSGGQMQRVAVARALVNRPTMVLADEPTGNLDTASGKGIVGLFQELHAGGQTVVMITHDLALARIASRVVQIRDGEIVEDQRAAA
jgi:putative ABC transport system ATP-binding protein